MKMKSVFFLVIGFTVFGANGKPGSSSLANLFGSSLNAAFSSILPGISNNVRTPLFQNPTIPFSTYTLQPVNTFSCPCMKNVMAPQIGTEQLRSNNQLLRTVPAPVTDGLVKVKSFKLPATQKTTVPSLFHANPTSAFPSFTTTFNPSSTGNIIPATQMSNPIYNVASVPSFSIGNTSPGKVAGKIFQEILLNPINDIISTPSLFSSPLRFRTA